MRCARALHSLAAGPSSGPGSKTYAAELTAEGDLITVSAVGRRRAAIRICSGRPPRSVLPPSERSSAQAANDELSEAKKMHFSSFLYARDVPGHVQQKVAQLSPTTRLPRIPRPQKI